MDIELYREFVVLAEELNFHKAAQRLCTTQSTLSKHIATLETHYRIKLFDRDRSHVRLTKHGVVLLDYADAICREYDASRDIMAQPESGGETLSISGILDSPGYFPIMLAVVELLKKQGHGVPRLLPCESASFKSQIALLKSGEAGLSVINATQNMVESLESEEIESELVGSQLLDAVVSEKNPLANLHEIRAEDLSNRTLIQLVGPRFTPSWKQIRRKLEESGVSCNSRPVSASSVYDYINIDPGNAVLLDTRIAPSVHMSGHPGTVRVPVSPESLVLELRALYLTDCRTPTTIAFIQALRECFRQAFT